MSLDRRTGMPKAQEVSALQIALKNAKRIHDAGILLSMGTDSGAQPIRVQGSDVAKALMQIAHEKNVGSIIIGHSRHGRLHELVRGSIVQKLLRLAGDVDVHVVADRAQGER